GISHDARTAVPRPDDINHIQVAFFDESIEMHIDKVQSRCSAPMAHQAWLNMRLLQWLFEQRIVHEIDLSNGKIIGRAPPGVHLTKHFGAQRALRRRSTKRAGPRAILLTSQFLNTAASGATITRKTFCACFHVSLSRVCFEKSSSFADSTTVP